MPQMKHLRKGVKMTEAQEYAVNHNWGLFQLSGMAANVKQLRVKRILSSDACNSITAALEKGVEEIKLHNLRCKSEPR